MWVWTQMKTAREGENVPKKRTVGAGGDDGTGGDGREGKGAERSGDSAGAETRGEWKEMIRRSAVRKGGRQGRDPMAAAAQRQGRWGLEGHERGRGLGNGDEWRP